MFRRLIRKIFRIGNQEVAQTLGTTHAQLITEIDNKLQKQKSRNEQIHKENLGSFATAFSELRELYKKSDSLWAVQTQIQAGIKEQNKSLNSLLEAQTEIVCEEIKTGRNIVRKGFSDAGLKRTHQTNSLEEKYINHTNQIKQQILDSFSQMEAAQKPSVTLTRRERLALDYAKKLFSYRVIYYPKELPTDKEPIGGKDKTLRQHWEDAARESVIYADKIIEASRKPVKSLRHPHEG